ncbi:MAG: hypothetical protein ACREDA_01775, partial [Methylocella sp.]
LIDFEQFQSAPSFIHNVQPPLTVFAEVNGIVSKKEADSATISGEAWQMRLRMRPLIKASFMSRHSFARDACQRSQFSSHTKYLILACSSLMENQQGP